MGLQRQQQQQNNNPNENHKWHHSYHLEAEQSSAGGRVEGNWFQPPLSLVSPGPPALLLPWPETPLWVSRLPSFHVSLSLRLEWPKWKPVSACAQDLWRVGLQRPSHALGRTKGPQSPRAFYWMEDAHINQTAAFFPSAWRAHFHPESPGWWGWAGGGWWASGGLGQWGGEQRGCSGHGGWGGPTRGAHWILSTKSLQTLLLGCLGTVAPIQGSELSSSLPSVTKNSNHFCIHTSPWMPLCWGVKLNLHSCFVFRQKRL